MAVKKKLSVLKKNLWKEFALHQKLVYSEDGEHCECYTCGKWMKIGTKDCQAGHCLSKAAYSILYFDERAVRPQCYYCNINLGGSEYVFNENLKQEIGLAAWTDMYENRHQKVKRDRIWYVDQIAYYKEAIQDLKKARGWI